LIEVLVILIAMAFALNIGASGAAAAISPAYGSGVLRWRTGALGLVAIAFVLGAVLAGGRVVDTLGGGLVDQQNLTVALVFIILLSATLPLLVSNLLGFPLSTSAVTVGAMVGAGLADSQMNGGMLTVIVCAWIALPVAAFVGAAGLSKLVGMRLELRFLRRPQTLTVRLLALVLVGGGTYVAFAAGANNVGNAIGPLVGAGILSSGTGLLIGGVVVGIGALVLGNRVLETSAKRVANLNVVSGTVVSGVSGSLVLTAALFGVPVPLVQVTSSAILGVGFARRGRKALKKQVVRDIASVWVTAPVVSLVLSYLLAHFTLESNLLGRGLTYLLLVVGFLVIVATLFVINRARLRHSMNRAKPLLLRTLIGILRTF
jgi:sulfate permease